MGLLLAGNAFAQTSAAIPPARSPAQSVVRAARGQVGITLYYDPSYTSLKYPGGDVPRAKGVCSDVVIRAFRAAGVDLQKEVHADMTRSFSAYPKLWNLKRPDKNIDHRRVANLQTFFKRKGKARNITQKGTDYLPGDVVAWRLPTGRLHIGVVSDQRATGGRPLVVHNIGAGAQEEDILFAYPVIGHYRYF